MRYSGFAGLIIAASIATLACSSSPQAQSAQPTQQSRGGANTGAAVPVSVAQSVQKPMPLDVHVIGTVEPAQSVTVHAQVTGLLTSVTFNEGDDVREGAVLFAIDPRPLE